MFHKRICPKGAKHALLPSSQMSSPQQQPVVVALLLQLQLQLLYLIDGSVASDGQLLTAALFVGHCTLCCSQLLLQAVDLPLELNGWLLQLQVQCLLPLLLQLIKQALLHFLRLPQLRVCCCKLLGEVPRQLLLQGQLLCCHVVLELQLAVGVRQLLKLLLLRKDNEGMQWHSVHCVLFHPIA